MGRIAPQVREKHLAQPRGGTRAAKHLGRAHVDQSSLTEEQRAIVTRGSGPSLIVAGAGTGKTRVLVERIAWLIGERGIPPQNILALTFTDKAAAELEARVDMALPISAFHPWIGTFHGFCESVLREHAVAIGLDDRFRVLSAPEAWLLLKRRLFDLPLARYRPLGNPTKFVHTLVEFFSHAKDQGVTPEALKRYAAEIAAPRSPKASEANKWEELASVYRGYVEIQRLAGVMDFGDLLLETLRLFRERDDILARYRKWYSEILVDEFQDTNATQCALLELLAGPRTQSAAGTRSRSRTAAPRLGNILVASDDDQAIFAFRGSNVENVLAFREQFPGADIAVLTENFRSPQVILDHAYALIQHNNPYRLEATAGIQKRLVSRQRSDHGTPYAEVISHRHFATEEAELGWVAEKIVALVDSGAAYRDIAILLRKNAQASDIVPSLLRRDIPHTVSESRGLLARPEVKDVLAYFRLLGNPTDGRALFRILTHPSFAVHAEDLARALALLRVPSRHTALSILEAPAFKGTLRSESRSGVSRLAGLLADHLRRFRTLQPSVIYLEFLERSGILRQAINESSVSPEVLPNLQAFLAYTRRLERGTDQGDLPEFLDLLDAATDGREGPPSTGLSLETDAVRLLTVHGAKGLEFPNVFILGASADRYPARGRHRALELPSDLLPSVSSLKEVGDRETHVLEERRLFYVALTRAQRMVFITSSTSAAGTTVRRKPSPFIAEAGIPSRDVAAEAETAKEQLALPLVMPRDPRPAADNALSLSASKITEYDTCPLKYKFHHVLRVPTPKNHALSFGTTIHDVLRDLARAVMAGGAPTVETALALFERHWNPLGYESVAHAEARRVAGQAALRAYLASHPEILNRTPLAAEAPFSLALPSTRLTGRIDRIDRGPDGSILVTDFKTGEGKGKDAARDTQLSLYALAVRQAFRLNPDRLRLSYLETGRDEDTTRTPEDDAKVSAHVEVVASRIRKSDFVATPGFHCRFCDFRTICDVADLS